jgi:L-alanine-DL-glutamate epimerase-like enolase superfamily enzyme
MKMMRKRFKKDVLRQEQSIGKTRRDFFRKAALGSMGLFYGHSLFGEEDDLTSQNVPKNSSPSDLKITDLRVINVGNTPLIKIYTNQDIYGLGEVRDSASGTYALMLKSRLLGKNPCNVEQIFKNIKQFGGHGRLAGGVCGVEMALWDLAGKAYNVPVFQMLGGKYRDQIRIYSGAGGRDAESTAENIKERIVQGFTFVKIRVWPSMLKDVPGAIIGEYNWDYSNPYNKEWMSYGQVPHPFNRMQLTDIGIDCIVDYFATIRSIAGWEIPIGVDHLGHFEHNTIIRLAKALDPYRLAFLEDLAPWFYHNQWKEITNSIETPTITGEDIYLKEEFMKLCDDHIVDIIHPDLATSGGILETKKIGDYAEEKGIPMFLHFGGSPVSLFANVHCAAATQNFVALEFNSHGRPGYEEMVTGIPKPIVSNGYIDVPNKPGLGIDLDEKVLKSRLKKGEELWPPSDEWNNENSWDRVWS